MGLIDRQLNKKKNKELTEPRFLETTLSPEQVVELVTGYCDQANADAKRRHREAAEEVSGWRKKFFDWVNDPSDDSGYHCDPLGACAVVSYPTPVHAKVGSNSGRWLATVETVPTEDGCGILVTLKGYVENGDGVIQHRAKYEALIAAIESAREQKPPTVARPAQSHVTQLRGKCKGCGGVMKVGVAFCPHCGKKLSWPSQTVPTS